jgi:hypothetical protein
MTSAAEVETGAVREATLPVVMSAKVRAGLLVGAAAAIVGLAVGLLLGRRTRTGRR